MKITSTKRTLNHGDTIRTYPRLLELLPNSGSTWQGVIILAQSENAGTIVYIPSGVLLQRFDTKKKVTVGDYVDNLILREGSGWVDCKSQVCLVIDP